MSSATGLPVGPGVAEGPGAPGALGGFETLIEEAVRDEGSRPALVPAGHAALTTAGDNGVHSGHWGLIAAAGVVVVGVGLLGTAAYALLQHEQGRSDAAQAAQQVAPEQAETSELILRGDGSGAGVAGYPEDADDEGITAAVDTTWADTLAAEADIPFRVMRAYAGASIRVSEEYPGCGIGWNTLAGIGFVESEHGTIDGGHIGRDGRASPPIFGLPLDGTSTDRIHDTDGGALDGDPVWDRAVGPMQFIPSTWADWAADGNGDGVADPQNIDDSTLAAARYLCEVGGDLRQAENWIVAVAAYNNTVEYNNRVADAADHYASFG